MVVAAFAPGCVLPSFDGPSWRDQLVSDGPCQHVNLLDGLDEASTAEVHALYDCVDQGQLGALAPAVTALDADTRDGAPAGLDLARAVNRLPDVGIDPFALAGVAVAAITDDRHDPAFWLDPLVELVYGQPAARVRSGAVDLDDPAALSAGIALPAVAAAATLAGAALDDDLGGVTLMGEIVGDLEAKRWARTADAWMRATHPGVADVVGPLPEHLGELLVDARRADNNRWPGSGDSLRDVVDVLAGPDPLLDDLAPPLHAMLGDGRVQTRLPSVIADWQVRGHLGAAAPQLVYLASIDVDGRAITGVEPSALRALIRLLHDTNRPVRCRVDLGFTDLDFDFDNLAVTLLEWLAGQDPENVEGLAGLVGALVGAPIASDVLDSVASSGVCDGITPQVAHDLRVVDRLGDGRAHDLVVVFVELLAELRDAERSRIPELADAATIVEDGGLSEPLEELIRDVGESDAVGDLVALVPVLYTPRAYGITAGPDDPVDLADVVDALVAAIDDRDGPSVWDRARPVVSPTVGDPATWTAIARLGDVLAANGSAWADIPAYVVALVDADPELVTFDTVASLLGDRAIAAPALRVLDTPAVAAAWQDPGTPGEASPLGFVGRVSADGTLDDLLGMIDLVLGALGA